VKWKGYRIETGEIERALLGLEGVREAAVQLWGEGDQERLLGYVGVGDKAVNGEKLRKELRKELPGYMVPGKVVVVERLPLTGNGKVAYGELPVPGEEEGAAEKERWEAEGEQEEVLVEVMMGVMGKKGLSMGDDFFELGGDSIRAIQVSSRLYRLGWELEVKDIFGSPELREMAGRMRALQSGIDQGAVEGKVPLSPIQQEFFGRELRHPHHYNQSLLLRTERRLEPGLMKRVLEELHRHHDALRMLFRRTAEGWEQWNRGPGVEVSVREVDLGARPSSELTAYAQQEQESLVLESGPLLKAVIFHTMDGDRLLLVAHHLVVDGVSWRILLEDLGWLYDRVLRGEECLLPLKTESFRRWSEGLLEEVGREGFLDRQRYWREQAETGMEEDWLSSTGQEGMGVEQFELTEEQTERLLREVNGVYHTEINDILLSALSLGWKEVYGRRKLRVMLEGHGRQGGPGLNVNRTVGWFTTVYPVELDGGEGAEVGRLIRDIKEQLRAVPDKGIGYGLLRYLYRGGEGLTAGPAAIVFNYLGQLDQDAHGNGFAIAPESPGRTSDPRERIRYPIAITARISNGRYSMTFETDWSKVPPQIARQLCQTVQQGLENILTLSPGAGHPTADWTSFQYKSLTTDTLATLFD
jgi:non-ribosomal peptide synthase protein (TIGR01720 family)